MSDIHLHSGDQEDSVIRSLPHAVGPEKSVLSSMLQSPQEFIGIAIEEGTIKDHFYLPAHSRLFEFMVELFGKNEEIELVSLIQHLLDRGLLDKIGGPATVTNLYTYAPTPGHFQHHLKLLKEKFTLRAMIGLGHTMIAQAYDSPDEPQELLDETERQVMAIRDGHDPVRGPTIKSSVEIALQELEARIKGEVAVGGGIATGFEVLDRMTNGGPKPGEMFVIGARPSMGKTSFLMNIVEHVCLDLELPSLVFSAEMSQQAIVNRLIYSRAKFAYSKLQPGMKPTKGDLQKIREAARRIVMAKLVIDDRASPSLNQIRAKARRAKREHDIQFIGIDYLQLIKSKSRQSDSSREREIAEISAGIKALSKDLSIPIVILSQLSRAAEQRSGKQPGKPRLSDLRESGSIEQDADLVGLLYRSAYYAESEDEKAEKAGEAELVLAKNRNGETGHIPLTFIAELMRFETGAPAAEEKDMFGGNSQQRSRHEY